MLRFCLPANSVVVVETDGYNLTSRTNQFTDYKGAVYDNSNLTCYITVTDGKATVVYTTAQMTYVQPGLWSIQLPASVFVSGNGPWTIRVNTYDQTGLTGRPIREFDVTVEQQT